VAARVAVAPSEAVRVFILRLLVVGVDLLVKEVVLTTASDGRYVDFPA
jgi:hypothetical protein